MQVFFDISIGDRAAYEKERAAFGRAEEFLAEKGAQFGLPPSATELSPEEIELLQAVYADDPVYQKRGPLRATPLADIFAGRLEIELFTDTCPKTCENFRQLCTGEAGKGKESGKALHYLNSTFHRSVHSAFLQGGDITRGDGSGGDSIYKGKFADEKAGLKLKHAEPGLLSMANSGKNANTSQFFLTLKPLPQLDGKHVVFGRVVRGISVLEAMNAVAHPKDGPPTSPITITACGQF
eukprot:NODE_4185_length_829_cov_20.705128_g4027_i0.p1 GENE.NODE_4185_length_829_cov_20.705128_g4027_i0~~NODE_4185_length_829_cov_20.705128_g4027_i0.p1  ORF type:complete len:249 (-),score=79.48 NODE_4185_length_829_cov_20.705128_g4027_i0:81-794(-)